MGSTPPPQNSSATQTDPPDHHGTMHSLYHSSRQHALTPKPHSLLTAASPTEPTDRHRAEPRFAGGYHRHGYPEKSVFLNSLWVLQRWSMSKIVPKS